MQYELTGQGFAQDPVKGKMTLETATMALRVENKSWEGGNDFLWQISQRFCVINGEKQKIQHSCLLASLNSWVLYLGDVKF